MLNVARTAQSIQNMLSAEGRLWREHEDPSTQESHDEIVETINMLAQDVMDGAQWASTASIMVMNNALDGETPHLSVHLEVADESGWPFEPRSSWD